MMFSGQWSVVGGQWPSHAEQSAAARRLLCQLVGSECVVDHDSQGAPFVVGRPELFISISHCRTAVAVAVSEKCRVGIDVECRRRVSQSLMERVCTVDELFAINEAADPTMQFLRCWTRKEAVLKCRGTGIRGFGSMLRALDAKDCDVSELAIDIADVVCSLAVMA